MKLSSFRASRWHDTIAVVEGALWVSYLWSAQWSLIHDRALPFVTASALMAAAVLIALGWRSMRLLLTRFRVRKRRTEMLMHILLPALLLAPPIWWVLERLVGNLPDTQRWTLAALLATAGWTVFVISVLIKRLINYYRNTSPEPQAPDPVDDARPATAVDPEPERDKA